MGKGDKKTKRGKIFMGSYGVRRTQSAKGYVPTEADAEKKNNRANAVAVGHSDDKPKKVKKAVEAVDAVSDEKAKAKKVAKKATEEDTTNLVAETE